LVFKRWGDAKPVSQWSVGSKLKWGLSLKNTLKKTTFCNTLPMILIGYGNHRMAWRIRKNHANFPISIHLEFHCRIGLVPMMEWLELGIHSKQTSSRKMLLSDWDDWSFPWIPSSHQQCCQ
jgi:hypothetical protein